MKAIIFDNISWNKIKTLLDIFSNSELLNLDTIKRLYSDEEPNFDEVLSFLINIHVVKILANKISLSYKLRLALNGDENTKKIFIANQLFHESNQFTNYLKEYFTKFVLSGGDYNFSPSLTERLSYSGIRNFLIGLGVLKVNYSSNNYYILKELLTDIISKNTSLSYHEFLQNRTAKEMLSMKVELAVIEEERQKFKDRPGIQTKIKLVSQLNVSAGYDILSFEESSNEKAVQEIYIEVKAVSEQDWKFYWSRNEIDTAKKFGDAYFLYLVPTGMSNAINVKSTQKIKNPYNIVYLNEMSWKRKVEEIMFYH